MSTSPHIAAYRAAAEAPRGKAAALAARTDAPATVSGAVISRESLCISAGVVPYIQIRISIQPFRENKGHIYILLCLRKNMHGPAVRAYQRCGEKSSKPLFISSSQCRPGRYASWPPDGGLSGNCRLREDILFPSLKLGNNTFDASRFARRCKQRQPQNMANITSDLSVRK